jgi:hypothetical protein
MACEPSAMAPPHPAHAKHARCHFPNAVRTCDAKGEIALAHPGQSVEEEEEEGAFRKEGGREDAPKDEEVAAAAAAAASSSSCRRFASAASSDKTDVSLDDGSVSRRFPVRVPTRAARAAASSSACRRRASAASSSAGARCGGAKPAWNPYGTGRAYSVVGAVSDPPFPEEKERGACGG